MGKEIVVINPDELERQMIQNPVQPGEIVEDLTIPIETGGTDPDEVITVTRQPFGK